MFVVFSIVFAQEQEPVVASEEDLGEAPPPGSVWSDAYILVRRTITAKDNAFITDAEFSVEFYAINVGTRYRRTLLRKLTK